jgi:hypothetical protein
MWGGFTGKNRGVKRDGRMVLGTTPGIANMFPPLA